MLVALERHLVGGGSRHYSPTGDLGQPGERGLIAQTAPGDIGARSASIQQQQRLAGGNLLEQLSQRLLVEALLEQRVKARVTRLPGNEVVLTLVRVAVARSEEHTSELQSP